MRIAIAAFLFLLMPVGLAAQPNDNISAIAGRAAAAYQAAHYDEAATLYRDVLRLAPRSVGARLELARSLARAGRSEEALDYLQQASEFGVSFDPADAAWSSLRSTERFRAIESSMRSRTAPIVRSTTAFLLEKDLIPENLAFDPKTRAFFVGSLYKAKILRIDADGTVADFVSPHRDGLTSVVGMKADPARRELWAVTGNFINSPPMDTDDPATRGKGALVRFDIDTGRLIRRYARPGGSPDAPTWFNDLVVAPGGDVYATGGAAIWRVRRDRDALELFVEVPGAFFNGIAITPDGRTLFVASHVDGVMKIDIATKKSRLLDLPKAVTLGGIDGLYYRDRSLIAVQNGIDPIRVIRASLDPKLRRITRFEVLEQGHPLSDIPLTGVIVGNDLYYIARSQLRAFRDGKILPAGQLQDTVILKLPLGSVRISISR